MALEEETSADRGETASASIEAAGGVDSYVHQIIHSIPATLLGVDGEGWLQQERLRNLAALEAEACRILRAVPPERLTEPSPSLLLPLLQACLDEGRETLREVWAALLANVLVDGGRRVRRDFFDVARRLEPADAVLLDIAGRAGAASPADLSQMIRARGVDQGLLPAEIEVSLTALTTLKCLRVNDFGHPFLTPFGLRFWGACQPPS